MVRSTPTQLISGAMLIAVAAALVLLVAAGPAAAFIDEGSQPGDTEPQSADEATNQRTTQSEGFIDSGEGAGVQSAPPSGGVDAGFGGTATDGATGAWSVVAVTLLALTVAGHVGVVGSRRRATTSHA